MSSEKRYSPWPDKATTIVWMTLAVLCSAVYGKTLFYGITNADDEVMITGNLPFLRDFTNVFNVFTTDAFYLHKEIDLYRPLQSLSYMIDAQWGGDVVFFAHLTNLLLHICCCAAIYQLLLRLEFRRTLAVTGALIYALHYLFMTAVAWLPARGDLLLALCTFMALLTMISSLEQPRWRTILLHLLFFTLALLAKESAILLPLLFAAYIWSHGKTAQLTRRHLLLPVYCVIAGSLYWLLKALAVADSSAERGLVPFMKNLHLLPEMVAKFYLPLNMSTLPAYKLSSTVGGVLIIAALLALFVTCRKLRNRQALFYPAWFLLFILPGMTYYPNFYSFSNEHVDHRAYLICFGLLLLNLYVLQQCVPVDSRAFKAGVICVLLYLTAFNLYLSPSYRNPEMFARKAIDMGSDSALAYTNYGAQKFLQGDELEALRYLNQSLRIVRKFMPALHWRARIYLRRGMYREALADLDTIFSVDPEYDAADYALRGEIKVRLQDFVAAEEDFHTALRLDPGLVDAGVALGGLYQARGELDEACTVWKDAAVMGSGAAGELIGRYCR
jgi:tetratricopeptide (TPR) repeat protein